MLSQTIRQARATTNAGATQKVQAMSAAGMAGGAAIAARSAAPQASQVGLKIISATVKTVTRPAQLAIQAVLVSIGWSGCDSGVGRGTVAVGGFTGRLRVIAPLRPL